MSPTLLATRNGVARAWTEFTAGLRNPPDVVGYLLLPVIFLVVLVFLRDNIVEGTSLSVAMLALPGLLGMLVTSSGMVSVATLLSIEREDGTLLRAKAIPNGVVGYMIGHVVRVSLETVTVLLIMLVPGLFIIDGLARGGVGDWLTLLWVLAFALFACVPIGLVIGAALKNPRAIGGIGFLVTGGLVAISGVFAPITDMAGWLRGIAQVFPLYWVGLGMRSALLPDEAMVVEISQSWRTLETLGVLSAWAVAGLLLAPVVLRRMARRESGSAVEERRRKALQRLG